jgi:hypothetical protein
MNQEVKILFELAYKPVVLKRKRLMGQDFLAVAFHLMDELKKQNNNPAFIQEAATTMVYAFNDMLNPKMSQYDMQDMIDSLVHGGMFIRAAAEASYEELKRLGYV